MKWFGLVMISVIALTKVSAQNKSLQFDQFTTEDGLSTDVFVRGGAITQDNVGFLWIGTSDGLNRFDGTQFVQYKYNSADTNTIRGKVISSGFADSRGLIWVGTVEQGLNVIDPKHGSIRHFSSANGRTVPSGHISEIFEDNLDRIWIAESGKGLFLYDRSTDSFQLKRLIEDDNLLNANNHFHHDITGIVNDPNDNNFVWFCTVAGLCKYNVITFESTFYTQLDSIDGGRNLHYDGRGNLWYCTWGKGLVKFDIESESFSRIYFNDPELNPDGLIWGLDIAAFSGDELLISSNHLGGLLYNLDTDSFRLLRDLASSDQVPKIPARFFNDRDGNIWMSTENEGIFCLQPQRQQLNRIEINSHLWRAVQDSKSDAIYVSSVSAPRMFRITPDNLAVEEISIDARNGKTPTGFPGMTIDESGNIWCLDWNDLYKLEASGSVARRVTWSAWEQGSQQFGYYWNIAIDREDNLWISAQSNGLGELNVLDRSFTLHGYENDNPRSMLRNYSVGGLHIDSQDRIWTTGRNGFSYYSKITADFENYPSPAEVSDDGQPITRLCAGIEGPDKNIWIAATLDRLGKIDPSDSVNTPVEIQIATSHLPNVIVNSMVFDKKGTLWIGSDVGLTRLDPPYQTAAHFGSTYGVGIVHNVCPLRDGRIVVVQNRQLLVVHRDSLRSFQVAPRPILNSFKVFDKPYGEIVDPNYLDNVILSHKQNFFSFEYSALDFANQGAANFAYMLEGLDEDWILINTSNQLKTNRKGKNNHPLSV